MKAMLRCVEDHGNHYDSIMYWCPAQYPPALGRDEGYVCGLHMLPVTDTGTGKPSWTLHSIDPLHIEPSVLSYWINDQRCHSFVRNGQIQFLDDCTHDLVGQTVELPDLPDWVTDESSEEWND